LGLSSLFNNNKRFQSSYVFGKAHFEEGFLDTLKLLYVAAVNKVAPLKPLKYNKCILSIPIYIRMSATTVISGDALALFLVLHV
jgi:hypothetical protein